MARLRIPQIFCKRIGIEQLSVESSTSILYWRNDNRIKLQHCVYLNPFYTFRKRRKFSIIKIAICFHVFWVAQRQSQSFLIYMTGWWCFLPADAYRKLPSSLFSRQPACHYFVPVDTTSIYRPETVVVWFIVFLVILAILIKCDLGS